MAYRSVPRYFFILLLLAVLPAGAQTTDWRQDIRQWLTVEDDTDMSDADDVLELLTDLAESKLDINRASREDLRRLPFLTDHHIEAILQYVDRYGPMRSLSELQMLPALDADTRRLLLHFVTVPSAPASSSASGSGSSASSGSGSSASSGSGSSSSSARPAPGGFPTGASAGRHSLMATARIPFYRRRGDDNGYLGYPYRHDLRYQFLFRDRLKFGITGAQDAGEPFFANKNTLGYDHYAYYFQLRHQGRLEQLNLGTYRLQLGMGLVINNGFHLGKLASMQSLGRNAQGLSAHTSRSSQGYLRGAAATVRLTDALRLTAFASCRPLDATLNDSNATVRTVLTDGYHRTVSELDRKHNTWLTDVGASIAWSSRTARDFSRSSRSFLTLTVLSSHFSRPLQPPTTAAYRRYAMAGSHFFNASLAYGHVNGRLSFSGETAVNGDAALATIHVLSVKAADQLSLMFLHRYYDRRYTAFHGYAFAEGGAVQNEHGVYAGASWQPSRSLYVQAYADYAHFPWLRYQVSAASDALDFTLRVRTLYNNIGLEGRYRYKLRQRDNADHTVLRNHPQHRLHLQATIPIGRPSSASSSRASGPSSSGSSSSGSASPAPGGFPTGSSAPALTLVTQADGVYLPTGAEPSASAGILLSQQAVLQYRWLRITASVVWFHTDDYDSRLYRYEPSVLHDFSFPAYYGHGWRYALMARADLSSRFRATVKIGTTDYFDRAVISSGLQQIDASSQTDLTLQLHYSF